MLSADSEDRGRVEEEAFLEEMEGWEQTLIRRSNKIKTNKTQLRNPLLINAADILLAEIDGQLLSYRKMRKNFKVDLYETQESDLIAVYNQLSRKFMVVMEKIDQFMEKSYGKVGQELSQTISLSRSDRRQDKPSFHKETFVSKINKEPIKKSSIQKSRNKTAREPALPTKSKTRNQKSISTSLYMNTNDDNIWDVRLQIKQLRVMIQDIKNQNKFHNHEELENVIHRIEHENNQMQIQIKTLKEDSKFMMERMKGLKQELQYEKKIQKKTVLYEMQNKQKSKSISESRKCPNVSDWVKVRI